jgi:hypothetical protein
MWTSDGINLYFGDCRPGDRAASDAEMATWRAACATVALKGQAQAALDKSDVTLLRCTENGVAVPMAWTTYRHALRAIVNGGDTTSVALPAIPAYPAGT